MQFNGYDSQSWRPIPYAQPSQSFAFYLVRRAMSRDAVIVLGCIAATWKIAVPELASYPHVVTPKQNRSVQISRGNFSPEDFERIERALKSRARTAVRCAPRGRGGQRPARASASFTSAARISPHACGCF
ncbi:hypothetical protein ACFY72_22370 [Streptomyces globisporus]|uniref:hypothetical protein n=1 Tax=Streptomyces albovinaceus subgroup TaxID=1482558 RepID=UPI001FCA35E7|nr:hypothetical protein [Streptomyces albovinaceus]